VGPALREGNQLNLRAKQIFPTTERTIAACARSLFVHHSRQPTPLNGNPAFRTSNSASEPRLPAIAVPIFTEPWWASAEVITEDGGQMSAMRARPFRGEHHIIVRGGAERPRIRLLTRGMPKLKEADRAVAAQGVHIAR
jgi:hypothetical protein